MGRSSFWRRKRRKQRVNEPLTDELLEELLTSSSIDVFANAPNFTNRSISDYLQELLAEKGLERAAVIREANLNYTFGYQIFVGTRKASRDKLLQVAFAMKLTLKETERLLQAGGVGELYCKNRRDAIIIFCIDHECSLQETNEELYRFGEETIC